MRIYDVHRKRSKTNAIFVCWFGARNTYNKDLYRRMAFVNIRIQHTLICTLRNAMRRREWRWRVKSESWGWREIASVSGHAKTRKLKNFHAIRRHWLATRDLKYELVIRCDADKVFLLLFRDIKYKYWVFTSFRRHKSFSYWIFNKIKHLVFIFC